MSTVRDKLTRLRERYADDMVIEPRHVFDLVEALNAQHDDAESVIGALLSSLADVEKRLDKIERRSRYTAPSSH